MKNILQYFFVILMLFLFPYDLFIGNSSYSFDGEVVMLLIISFIAKLFLNRKYNQINNISYFLVLFVLLSLCVNLNFEEFLHSELLTVITILLLASFTYFIVYAVNFVYYVNFTNRIIKENDKVVAYVIFLLFTISIASLLMQRDLRLTNKPEEIIWFWCLMSLPLILFFIKLILSIYSEQLRKITYAWFLIVPLALTLPFTNGVLKNITYLMMWLSFARIIRVYYKSRENKFKNIDSSYIVFAILFVLWLLYEGEYKDSIFKFSLLCVSLRILYIIWRNVKVTILVKRYFRLYSLGNINDITKYVDHNISKNLAEKGRRDLLNQVPVVINKLLSKNKICEGDFGYFIYQKERLESFINSSPFFTGDDICDYVSNKSIDINKLADMLVSLGYIKKIDTKLWKSNFYTGDDLIEETIILDD